MKKLILLMVIAVFGLTTMNAQDIQFGAKVGVNLASISGDNTGEASSVTSFNFGAVAEIPITERFSFQPEAMYSGQGFDAYGQTVELNYINVPLMAKYYVIKGLSVEAGPQIGFLVSAKNEDIDIKDSFSSVDFGVNLGLGYKLDNGINFGARYNLGLSDINDVEGVSSKNQNGVFQISIGYFFF